MKQIDVLYRAFRDLSKQLDENHGVAAMENTIANARESDKIVVVHNICHVEEDWVAAIERGLVYIGKAIEEDRQFIRSNGEVQPIEKVKHVSRESVQHLSRHSDFITRKQEAEKGDLIPDKLYTVERLNDYTVYENRFLYLLLCRLRDFVTYRYESILRAYRLYRGELTARKKVVTGTRKLTYEVNFVDEQDDVLDASTDPECAYYLDRIEKIQQSVAFYLRTPIMVEVSHVDKIKSKITKTNVLRMDKNFKEAVTLYEFLLAYDRDGFTITPEEKRLDPVPEAVARDLAAPVLLAALLMYEHGLGVQNALQEEFDKEEVRREEARQAALAEAIRQLKKRVAETGKGIEEYALMLEERNAALEKDSKLLKEARAEIEKLKENIETLTMEVRTLRTEVERLNDVNSALQADMKRAEEEHRQQVEEMNRERAEAEAALKKEHTEALIRAEETRRADVARVQDECDARLAENQALMEEETQKRVTAEKTQESVSRELDVYKARLTAVRSERGLLTPADDFTTEAGFTALEREFETLGRLVRKNWTDVKKILKKEFSGNIRAVMRGKKGEKSAEYRKLSAEVQARRPPAPPKPAAAQGVQPKPAAAQGVQPKPAAAQGVQPKPAAAQGVQPKPAAAAQGTQPKPAAAQPKPQTPPQPAGAPQAAAKPAGATKPAAQPRAAKADAPKEGARPKPAARSKPAKADAPKGVAAKTQTKTSDAPATGAQAGVKEPQTNGQKETAIAGAGKKENQAKR